ncbi:spermidine/spermine N(1)-acetyltransferase-like protein 1 [Phyllostomus hastatus]|uniref:spermidine/spermine N(1)-acetyltransferase-like protein 1 n=1 Tax=Phyllostomus hastatus TaxID=9423 RepID=UPI001E682CCC|nr:spermidine/spermine N(1)-acetyltransferase-like protein 1 [Phyllostomus hastatus]
MVPIPSKHLVISQPVGCQLIIHQPVLSQPGTNQQTMNQSSTRKLDTSMNPLDIYQPGTSLPGMNPLGMKQPVVSQPRTGQPGITETEMSQPGSIQPSVRQLFISKLYKGQYSTSDLDMKQPDLSDFSMNPLHLGQSQPIVIEPGTKQADLSEFGMSQLHLGQSQSIMIEPGMKQQDLTESAMGQLQLRGRQSIRSKPGMKQPQVGQSQSTHNESGMKQAGPSQSGMREPRMKPPNPTSPSPTCRNQPCTNFFQIRSAEARDCIKILQLIQESAASENMPHVVKLTAADLLRDGFGDRPLFYCLIAEVFGKQTPSGQATAGFAMYYFTYDGWTGKLLYIEDFFVTVPFRGLGIGTAMLKSLSQIALRSECNGMRFYAVLWNGASTDCATPQGATGLFSREGRYLLRINKEKLLYLAGEQ